mgnify:CR=1 FL=1
MRFNSVWILLLFAAFASACAKTATTASATRESPSPVTAAQNDQELERLREVLVVAEVDLVMMPAVLS